MTPSPHLSSTFISTISCPKSQITTNGKGSPLIDAKGTIFLNNIIGNASNSQAIIIDGVESLNIGTNSNITCSGKGIAEDSSDSCGILIKNTTKNDRVESTALYLFSRYSWPPARSLRHTHSHIYIAFTHSICPLNP